MPEWFQCFCSNQLKFDANCFLKLNWYATMSNMHFIFLSFFLSFLCFFLLSVLSQKRRRPTTGGQLDDKRREMLKRHPLSLCLDLKCKGNTVSVFDISGCTSPCEAHSPSLHSMLQMICIALLSCIVPILCHVGAQSSQIACEIIRQWPTLL